MKIIMEEKITAWIARDKNMCLYIFFERPKKFEKHRCWDLENADGLWGTNKELNKDLFPQVKWEDEEPIKVELTIKICE